MKERSNDVRRWHYIKRNSKTVTPTNVLFVDTETHGEPIEGEPNVTLQVLSLWCVTHCRLERGRIRSRKDYSDDTPGSFWALVDKLLDPKRPLWLFAHNLGFDLTVLRFWHYLEEGRFSFGDPPPEGTNFKRRSLGAKWHGFAVLDDPPVILEVQRSNPRATLIAVDTYNYFRQSVAKLGDSIGLPKMAMPIDPSNKESMQVYCQRDVAIIMRAITGLMAFVQEKDLGMFRYTAPAQAFSAFRHRFMRHRILVHGNKDALQLEREAYYGGRLENHFVGTIKSKDTETAEYYGQAPSDKWGERIGPVHVLDINSCYPWIMRHAPMPYKIVEEAKMITPSLLWDTINDGLWIARVTISSVREIFPCHRNGKTFMASGRFVTSLCGPELFRALQTGSVANVGYAVMYDGELIFQDYVDFFWKLRQEYKEQGNHAKAEWAKLMLNSLSGKFGQRATRWVEREDVDAALPWHQWSMRDTVSGKSGSFRSLAWAVQQKQDIGESADSCPAIPAFITSNAREYLHKLIECAGWDNVYYVDTDCLHVNDAGLLRLTQSNAIGGNQLGLLSLRGTYETAEYRGLKDYSLEDNHVISGVKANAEAVRRGLFRQDKFQKLRSILASNPPDGVRVERVTIDRRIGLDPQRIQADGSVLPQVVYE